MPAIAASVHINRPVAAVFAYITRVENTPRWIRAYTKAELVTPGPLGPGSRIRYIGKGNDPAEYKVVAFEPDRRLDLAEAKKASSLSSYRLEPEGSGTHLTCFLELNAGESRIARFMVNMVAAGLLSKAVSASLDLLKQQLENPGAAQAAAAATASPVPPASLPALIGPETPGERFATAFLVGANLVPLVGVLGFGWDVGSIVLLYWCENIIAGFYTVLRIATASGPAFAKVGMIPFFIFHYGMFCTVHGVFVVSIFHLEKVVNVPAFSALQLFGAAARMPGMYWPLLALFISHGVSFMENHFVRGERRTADLGMLMMRPYGRMIALHVAIIFGGFLAMAMNSPTGVLVVLVLIKLGIDVATHRRWVHKGAGPGALTLSASAGE